jgi:hypothetical protein
MFSLPSKDSADRARTPGLPVTGGLGGLNGQLPFEVGLLPVLPLILPVAGNLTQTTRPTCKLQGNLIRRKEMH